MREDFNENTFKPDLEYDRLFWQDEIPPYEYIEELIIWGTHWKAKANRLEKELDKKVK